MIRPRAGCAPAISGSASCGAGKAGGRTTRGSNRLWCLNANRFSSLADARAKIEARRRPGRLPNGTRRLTFRPDQDPGTVMSWPALVDDWSADGE